MKTLLYLLLSVSFLFSASVESKIKKNNKQLSSKKSEYKKMDKQLANVAKKINSAKVEQSKLAEKLKVLATNIENNEVEFARLQKEDKKYATSLANSNKTIAKKQKKFLELVSTNFSLALAQEELKQPTPDSIMMKEIYKLYEQKNTKSIEVLKQEISKLNQKKSDIKSKKARIEKQIAIYTKERNEYKLKKEKQDVIVQNLARDRAIYKKRFNKIKAARKSLESKLAKLKIIKRSKDKAKRDAKKAEANVRRAATKTPKTLSSPSSPTAKYTGGKIASPLKGSRLIKKFGTYIDPIYKFKIFNKSVTLKAPHSGSKVRSVLPGKVVFAENSGGMLGKVVIVEHANNMHTIYAKLSRLAPGIHVGKQLVKSAVIGKVDKSLMFEVTKNNKHINPMKLIRL